MTSVRLMRYATGQEASGEWIGGALTTSSASVTPAPTTSVTDN